MAYQGALTVYPSTGAHPYHLNLQMPTHAKDFHYTACYHNFSTKYGYCRTQGMHISDITSYEIGGSRLFMFQEALIF